MMTMHIFLIVSLIGNVWMINNTIPDIPLSISPETKLFPRRSDEIKINFTFGVHIPVLCFCDKPKCSAKIESIEPPVMGLFTRDEKVVKSIDIEVGEGELMYIILLDSNSSLGNDTYLEQITYWHLADSQHKLLPEAAFDLEIQRQILVSEKRDVNVRYYVGLEKKHIVINALEITTGLSIAIPEEVENKNSYHYSASPYNQVVTVYQLYQELIIHPGASLIDYIENQESGARCTQYLIFSQACGVLELLPSFIKRTPIFSQVAVNITTPDTTMIVLTGSTSIVSETSTLVMLEGSTATTVVSKKPSRKKLSKSTKATLISVSIVVALLFTFAGAIGCYIRARRSSRGTGHVRLSLIPDDIDAIHD